MADVESKSIPHELPSSHWLKATGQCVLERYLSATMMLTAICLLNISFRFQRSFCNWLRMQPQSISKVIVADS